MATFPNIKSLYEIPQITKFRVLRNEFGNGYSQRSADGLNYKTNDFTYEVFVNTTNAQTIIDFLDARGGYESFDYTLPREVTSKKWTCQEYTRIPIGPNVDKISAIFKQEFDLD